MALYTFYVLFYITTRFQSKPTWHWWVHSPFIFPHLFLWVAGSPCSSFHPYTCYLNLTFWFFLCFWLLTLILSFLYFPTAVPTKVEEAFKAFHYILYLSLTHMEHLKAAWVEEDFVINSLGSLMACGLDHYNEWSISIINWHAAASAAVIQNQ